MNRGMESFAHTFATPFQVRQCLSLTVGECFADKRLPDLLGGDSESLAQFTDIEWSDGTEIDVWCPDNRGFTATGGTYEKACHLPRRYRI